MAKSIVYLGERARWRFIKKNISNPDIGFIIDDAMKEIQQQQPKWGGSLPGNYSASDVDTMYVRKCIEYISSIDYNGKYREIWSTLFERFLMMFPDLEGKSSGGFYTPRSIIELMAKTIDTKSGSIYDPCSGSGGILALSSNFISNRIENKDNISIFGQELMEGTAKIATMYMAIQGLDVNIRSGNTLYKDLFPDLKVDYVLANPPFNINWQPESSYNDERWFYGVPPASNANYAWLQHCINKLKPGGLAAVIMPNGSLSSSNRRESEIRKSMIQADIVQMIVALPPYLFYSTPIPVSLWLMAKNKGESTQNKVLFIDATGFGKMLNNRNRDLTTDDITNITNIYHNWRNGSTDYRDVSGLCRSASLREIAENNYNLLPSKYVGIVEDDMDEFDFDETMNNLAKRLSEQFTKSAELEEIIQQTLKDLGYDFR